jgi:hypothetical protein
VQASAGHTFAKVRVGRSIRLARSKFSQLIQLLMSSDEFDRMAPVLVGVSFGVPF